MRHGAQHLLVAMLLTGCPAVNLGSDVDGGAGGLAGAGGGIAGGMAGGGTSGTGGGVAGGDATGGGAATGGGDSGVDAGSDAGFDSGTVTDAGLPSGQLDLSFNQTGFVTRVVPGVQEEGFGVTHDSQGRIVIGGYTSRPSGTVWRLTSDGRFDPSFGDAGEWSSGLQTSMVVAVDAQDRTVAGGQLPGPYAAFWRVDAAGTLDSTFGASGLASPWVSESARAVRVLPNTDLLVASAVRNLDSGVVSAVVKLSSSGVPVPGFGIGGVARGRGTDISPINDNAFDVVVDASGRAIAVGTSADALFRYSLALWRFTPAGEADLTFGDGGCSPILNIAGGTPVSDHNDPGYGIALDSHERILVTGYSVAGGTNHPYVGRISDDGTPDPTFGDGGFVLLSGLGSNSNGVAFDIAVDSLDQIIVAGQASPGGNSNALMVWRLRADGTVDLSFGDAGVFTMIGTAGGSRDILRALSIDAQRRPVVVGGTSDDAGLLRLGVWRLTP